MKHKAMKWLRWLDVAIGAAVLVWGVSLGNAWIIGAGVLGIALALANTAAHVDRWLRGRLLPRQENG